MELLKSIAEENGMIVSLFGGIHGMITISVAIVLFIVLAGMVVHLLVKGTASEDQEFTKRADRLGYIRKESESN